MNARAGFGKPIHDGGAAWSATSTCATDVVEGRKVGAETRRRGRTSWLVHERKRESERERHVEEDMGEDMWRGAAGVTACQLSGRFVVCGVPLQRTYCLKWAAPWCRVLCSVCCLVGFQKKKKQKKNEN